MLERASVRVFLLGSLLFLYIHCHASDNRDHNLEKDENFPMSHI